MFSKLGPEALVESLDIKNTFRLLPVHKSDFQFLEYKFRVKYLWVSVDLLDVLEAAKHLRNFEPFRGGSQAASQKH